MQLTSTITTGVKLFVQMTALRNDPYEAKWVRDEEDLRLALEQVADNLKYTKSMIGKTMYKGQTTFDFVHDVKRAMEYTLLIGEDDRETAGLRRRNLSMYHLILEPVIEQLGTATHTDAIDIADAYTTAVYDYACNEDINMHFDDALVAKAIVKSMVRERDEARRAVLDSKKKRSKKKKDPSLIEELEAALEELALE